MSKHDRNFRRKHWLVGALLILGNAACSNESPQQDSHLNAVSSSNVDGQIRTTEGVAAVTASYLDRRARFRVTGINDQRQRVWSEKIGVSTTTSYEYIEVSRSNQSINLIRQVEGDPDQMISVEIDLATMTINDKRWDSSSNGAVKKTLLYKIDEQSMSGIMRFTMPNGLDADTFTISVVDARGEQATLTESGSIGETLQIMPPPGEYTIEAEILANGQVTHSTKDCSRSPLIEANKALGAVLTIDEDSPGPIMPEVVVCQADLGQDAPLLSEPSDDQDATTSFSNISIYETRRDPIIHFSSYQMCRLSDIELRTANGIVTSPIEMSGDERTLTLKVSKLLASVEPTESPVYLEQFFEGISPKNATCTYSRYTTGGYVVFGPNTPLYNLDLKTLGSDIYIFTYGHDYISPPYINFPDSSEVFIRTK